MRRAFLILLIFLTPLVAADQFPNQKQNSGSVGWQVAEDEKIGQFRLSYPANSDGEENSMAQSGPFAVVVFYTDAGESVEQYEWFQEEISRWGYITLVVEDETSFAAVETTLRGWNNGSIISVQGAQGMFALDHISLGGHGTGAHFAAEVVKSTDYQIHGLFGLGLDGDVTEYSESVVLSRPSIALFLTGTTDNIAPANENVASYLNTWPGAWQVMYPRGANHIGYQESDTFFERLADGDSTMGRNGQQQHALQHILPYLNLSLRGDDDSYQAAFNREDKTISVDSDSYIDEDLSKSRLYKMENITSSLFSVMLDQSFTVSSNVTMRDGSSAFGNVSCIIPSGTTIQGTLQNSTASCDLNGSDLLPGPSQIELRIEDHSFSDWLDIFVSRVGTPMQITNPIPEIFLNQHGSVTVDADIFATDPDGEEIKFQSVLLFGENSTKFEVENQQEEIIISHVNDQEWDGESQINLTLMTSDESVQIIANITLLPVNDPVVQYETVPQQASSEDGDDIIIDFANYVLDPEGEQLLVVAAREYSGITINSISSSVLIDPQTHWNGAELIEFYVSDGVTEPLQVFVPINIEPVEDNVEFTSNSFSVDIDEDATKSINLGNYTINVDDDPLNFTVEGESEILDYSLSGNELLLVPAPNMHGLVIYTINVSDGFSSSSAEFSINIKEIPDLPTVSISTLDYSGNVLSILWTISDQDGDEGLIYSVKFANNSIEKNTECSGNVLLTCLTTTNTNQFGTYEVEVKVWDGNAEEWSNVDTKEIELIPVGNTVDESGSDILIGDWLLPIGLGIIVLLLLGYILMTRK
mgnify:CR=1 FL=1